MNAVIYARFSCSKQREASIEDQIRVCREWCESNGYTVLRVYSDSAQSGRTDERAAFQEMVSNAGESEIVLVYAWDRFSRDKYDFTIYKRRFQEKGCKVISATEPLSNGIEAILLESMYEALAVIESERTSQRVKRGMEGNARKCHWNGNKLFGYDVDSNGRYIENESESQIVREVFERKVSGDSISAITKSLASRGIGARGKPATYGFVHNMLRNERYTGVYIWGDVRISGGMPMLIEPEVFKAAQTSRSKRTGKHDYALTGKLLCPVCGYDLSGMVAKGRSKQYHYYRCKHCKEIKPIRADILESGIAAAIREFLSNRETALRIAVLVAESMQDTNAKIKGLRSQLTDAQRQIDNILDAVAQGLNGKAAQQKIDPLQAKIETLEKQIAIAESTAKFDPEDFADFLQFGATLTDDHLLQVFVYQVLANDNEVLVTLDYDIRKDEPARLHLPPVRPVSNWWTISKTSQTAVTVLDGSIILRFRRIA